MVFFAPVRIFARFEIFVKIKTSGCKTIFQKVRKPERPKAIFSGNFEPRVLGVISPNINKRSVTTKVAAATPALPKSSRDILVKIDEIEMFTILLPIRIVLISSSCLSRSLPTLMAFLTFFLRKKRILNLFTDKKALSDIENKEDNISRTTATASNSTILEGGSEEGTYSSPVEFCILVSDSIVKRIESASSDSGAAS